MLRRNVWEWGRRIAVLGLVHGLVLCLVLTKDVKAGYNPPYAAIVIDANTDKVLFSRSADAKRYPASLTKMMTLYLLFDAIESGKVTKQTRMKVSRRAAGQPPSKLALKPGQTIKVHHAILSLVTKSANDVAVVIAEHLAGSEIAFARKMTAKARELGMKNTRFMNASGLPNKNQVTTARDMTILSKALIRNHPKHYRYFATRYFKYKGRRYRNHNRLLGKVRGVDGIKTGYIRASGFNLASSARRGNKHLIAVVMGGKSGRSRNAHMTNLLRRHFPKASNFKRIPIEDVPLPPIRPMSVNYSEMPAAPAENEVAAAKPQTPAQSEPIKADSVTLHAASQVRLAARQTTIITPTARPERVAAGARVTDEIAKLLNEQWLIQIGAYGDRQSAASKLDEARQTFTSLGQQLAYVEPVEKNAVTLWRARFSGFDKAAARDACVKLKRANFRCLAIRQ